MVRYAPLESPQPGDVFLSTVDRLRLRLRLPVAVAVVAASDVVVVVLFDFH